MQQVLDSKGQRVIVKSLDTWRPRREREDVGHPCAIPSGAGRLGR